MEEDNGANEEDEAEYSIRVSADETVSTLGGGAWEEPPDDHARPRPADEVRLFMKRPLPHGPTPLPQMMYPRRPPAQSTDTAAPLPI